MRNVIANKQHFQTIFLAQVLITEVLLLAHNALSHNDTTITYLLLIRHYYWKGLKTVVSKYIKQYLIC